MKRNLSPNENKDAIKISEYRVNLELTNIDNSEKNKSNGSKKSL